MSSPELGRPFSPADMRQCRTFAPAFADSALSQVEKPEVIPFPSGVLPVYSSGIEDQQTHGNQEVGPRPSSKNKLINEHEAAFGRSIRRALNGGNPDVVGRKPGDGKSFRYI